MYSARPPRHVLCTTSGFHVLCRGVLAPGELLFAACTLAVLQAVQRRMTAM